MTKELIMNAITYRKNGAINPNSIKHLIPTIIEITSFLEPSSGIPERIYCILHDITTKPICKCGSNKPLSFRNTKQGYYETCSRSCPIKTQKRNESISDSKWTDERREKVKQTNLDRYGVVNPFQTDYAKTKSQEPDVKKFRNRRIKESVRSKYGVDNVFQLDSVQEKAKDTTHAKYGVDNIMQTDEMKKRFSKQLSRAALGNSTYMKISSKEWWDVNYTDNLKDIVNLLGVSHSCAQVWAHRLGVEVYQPMVSEQERKIQQLLMDLGVEFIPNRYNTIGKQLDILIPGHNLAIEVNGIYWHSELAGNKSKTYHLDKTIDCRDKGIHLLHFWDIEINEKFGIVSSIIKSHLGMNNRIPARKCKVIEVDSKTARIFLEQNHIQGHTPASIRLGLVYEGELVQMMTFIKSRYSKHHDWELGRLCTKIGHTIVGGAKKLFQRRPEGTIVSYSDERLFQGKIYNTLGFSLVRTNSPSYWYINGKRLMNRVMFQKHKLSKLLTQFESSLSEWENMVINGYDRVWDCGTKTWEYMGKE